MKKFTNLKIFGSDYFSPTIKMSLVLILFFQGCAKHFNFKECINNPPNDFKVLHHSGTRTLENILANLGEPYCVITELYRKHNRQKGSTEAGFIKVKMIVEYTGELLSAQILKSTITDGTLLVNIHQYFADYEFTFFGSSNSPDTHITFAYQLPKW